VEVAFTSNIIRKIWHERQGDSKFAKANKGISKDIYYVKTPLAAIASLQDQGYTTIIVQPTHIYEGEEYADLSSFVKGLNSIETIKQNLMPFDKLVLGRPILGKKGIEYDYHEDIKICANAMKSDIDLAKKNKAALVYMGHGNEYYSTGVYVEFQQVMRKMYPDVPVFVGTVEGFPSIEDVELGLKHSKVKNVVLKPFMIVAGDHASNDMAGDEEDSWKTIIESMGINVVPVVSGLGENSEIADILIGHIKDVAKDNNIKL
jgi:sirohydrochlorin cobaltochelatase